MKASEYDVSKIKYNIRRCEHDLEYSCNRSRHLYGVFLQHWSRSPLSNIRRSASIIIRRIFRRSISRCISAWRPRRWASGRSCLKATASCRSPSCWRTARSLQAQKRFGRVRCLRRCCLPLSAHGIRSSLTGAVCAFEDIPPARHGTHG